MDVVFKTENLALDCVLFVRSGAVISAISWCTKLDRYTVEISLCDPTCDDGLLARQTSSEFVPHSCPSGTWFCCGTCVTGLRRVRFICVPLYVCRISINLEQWQCRFLPMNKNHFTDVLLLLHSSIESSADWITLVHKGSSLLLTAISTVNNAGTFAAWQLSVLINYK